MEDFLLQATIYLAAMVIAVPLSVRFGMGSVLGYLLAGIMIGPVLGLVGAETEDLQHFAEFGVVLMLFLIGLELDPKGLWEMRKKLVGLGGAQIVLSTAALAGGAALLGFAWQTSLAIGLILALSSTAIVLQTLNEKKLMQTNGGRSAFSVLLTQDIAVIPMLALLPLLAVPGLVSFGEDGSIQRAVEDDAHHTMSLVEGLPGWGVTLVTLGAVAAVILGGYFLSRPLFRFIHMARLREMYTAVALVIVVGIAFLMILVGLSPALGAFVAGVVLANSEFRHELEADIEPFKGLLLGLFFITVGAGINFRVLWDSFFVVVGLTLAVMTVKGVLLYGIGLIFRLRGRNLWLFTLGLAQAGEFGFVLISFSLQQTVLPIHIGEMLLLVVALSMLLTPLFFILYDYLSRRMGEANDENPEPDRIDAKAPVIIAGIGRFGQVVNRMVQASGFKTIVLDSDLSTIQLMRKFGFRGFFGDPTRPELLHAAGLDDASVLVVAVDDKQAAVNLVSYARRLRPDIAITARAHDRLHVYELYNAGADHIVREMFDSSLRAARYVLEDMGMTDYEAHELETAFYRHDRQNLRSLADVWVPGVPVTQNDAYMERARELNNNLETALVTQLDEMAHDEPPQTGKRRTRSDAGALKGVIARQNATQNPGDG
ncbi:potassium transporter [Roseobacter sp. HKCCD9010]|uniref:monovalent cation:proton antiporter-2 (CPA2) family protein n=1 Tax=unclassified Roseobacter TaxID=196798 RepID=UPI00149315E9|nr:MULTISPECIES: monovalent cation:proton antiporter-2 (CPA2) family protein [unclassified Roseobacter]MBF9049207.1 potassium transporter [Rhodobacterales bacterium HKCCD4356]NNV11207.1 potassium transporter [Roseobacter sp. HKCCD7357]NNV15391.1 potassium transporter [Roseobacter sp. HKCCD8768]NNV24851.1 potassium transporter [Roseobacter sp. HKCCD8192]NNV29107.1 potassium transporter [Roseobacter sp. HKCCD9061]